MNKNYTKKKLFSILLIYSTLQKRIKSSGERKRAIFLRDRYIKIRAIFMSNHFQITMTI